MSPKCPSRVLVVSTTFPQFDGDPRGAFILTHWEQRAARGEHVRIVAPRTSWCRGRLRSRCAIQRVAYAPARASTLTGNFGILENIRQRPWRAALLAPLWVSLRAALRRALDEQPWDRLVAHMLLPGGWIAAQLCRSRAVSLELYGHGTDVDLLLGLPGFVRRRFWSHAQRAAVIHLPSRDKAQRFCRAFGLAADDPRLRVEPMIHCVPEPEGGPTPEQPRRPEILYLGRLIAQKGVDDLIAAVAMMRPRRVLHIAGEGPQRRKLERLARRLGVDARFHGFVRGAEKLALLDSAAVLCVPSRRVFGGLSEGSPLVVLEALARGLPVVATSVGGIPELCSDDARVQLVPAGSPIALSSALSRVFGGGGPIDTHVERVC